MSKTKSIQKYVIDFSNHKDILIKSSFILSSGIIVKRFGEYIVSIGILLILLGILGLLYGIYIWNKTNK